MSKLNYKELNSKRLFLRMFKETDYSYQYDYLSNPANYPFADLKIAESKKDINEFFEKMLKEHLETSLFWMIINKETNKPIGTLSAWNVNWEELTIEFGYSLYPQYRGFGYMKEAIETAIDFLRKENGFQVFDIWTDKGNAPSIKLAEELGFFFEGYVVEKAQNTDKEIVYATYRLNLRKGSRMNIKQEEVNYKNFGKCLKITNNRVELVVTLDCGPRIISYRLINGENIFFEDTERLSFLNNSEMDKIFYKGATWHGLGGHRLWRAPETFNTYYPDNNPVEYKTEGSSYIFYQEKQEKNGIQLSIKLSFISETEIQFEGTVTNNSNEEKTLSSWSLSMCKGPGFEIVKLPDDETGFKPQRYYSFWGFGAKNNDPRAYYGDKYFALKMEPGNQKPFKVGMKVTDGKILYLTEDTAYIKKFERLDNCSYPDNNVNYETYTKDLFMELETLSPLTKLKPKDSVTQTEIWDLVKFEDEIPTEFDEEELDKLYEKYANKKV